jgi:uncharacterized protein YuzB (UPF0349 family)
VADVTDLTKNLVTADDQTSTQLPEDSNVNVFEFGNLILADILPALISLLNVVADYSGDLATVTDYVNSISGIQDISGSSLDFSDKTNLSLSEDSNVNVYEFGNLILADILPTVLFVMGAVLDIQGSSVANEDLLGSSTLIGDISSSFDTEDSNINVFEFGNLILADVLPTLTYLILSIADISGNTVSTVDKVASTNIPYDSPVDTYDSESINYLGLVLQGSVVDIVGS